MRLLHLIALIMTQVTRLSTAAATIPDCYDLITKEDAIVTKINAIGVDCTELADFRVFQQLPEAPLCECAVAIQQLHGIQKKNHGFPDCMLQVTHANDRASKHHLMTLKQYLATTLPITCVMSTDGSSEEQDDRPTNATSHSMEDEPKNEKDQNKNTSTSTSIAESMENKTMSPVPSTAVSTATPVASWPLNKRPSSPLMSPAPSPLPLTSPTPSSIADAKQAPAKTQLKHTPAASRAPHCIISYQTAALSAMIGSWILSF